MSARGMDLFCQTPGFGELHTTIACPPSFSVRLCQRVYYSKSVSVCLCFAWVYTLDNASFLSYRKYASFTFDLMHEGLRPDLTYWAHQTESPCHNVFPYPIPYIGHRTLPLLLYLLHLHSPAPITINHRHSSPSPAAWRFKAIFLHSSIRVTISTMLCKVLLL